MAENPFQRLQRFLAELRRRKVYRVSAGYLVSAFVVLQLAGLAAGAFAFPDWFQPMVWVVAGLGFPLAVVLAWAFEVTPEGVRRTPKAEPTEGAGERPGGTRPGSDVLVAITVLAMAVVGGWYLTSGSGGPSPERAAATDSSRTETRSIAVLPFENMGGEESEQFTEGVHDGLLTRLSNVSDLAVISRTSVMRYEETDKTVPQIARELGANWLVEGAVQQAGEQVQVNAQLIHAREDAHMWAKTYRRDLTPENLFAIQGELTREIARSLEAELSPEEEGRVARNPTSDMEAYRLYVQGRTHLEQRTETDMRRAIELFADAVARDSGYALAWSGLAEARTLLAWYGHAPPDSMYPAALQNARRALKLESDLAEAHSALGLLYRAHLGNLPAALRAFERAVALKPNYAQAYQWLAELTAALGRPERALVQAQKAVELDPRSPSNRLTLAWMYWWVEGPGEKALEHVRKAGELEPGYALAYVDEGLMHSDAGRHEEAIAALERGLELAQEGSLSWSLALGGLGAAYAGSGDTARARRMLGRLAEQGRAPLREAMVHAALGGQSDAFRALADVEWTGIKLYNLRSMPVFDSLRGDPRYRKLVREINRQWGLDPDGSLPDSVDVSFGAESDEGTLRSPPALPPGAQAAERLQGGGNLRCGRLRRSPGRESPDSRDDAPGLGRSAVRRPRRSRLSRLGRRGLGRRDEPRGDAADGEAGVRGIRRRQTGVAAVGERSVALGR